MYGHCTAGLFGYSELMGGYEGLQASHARIPLADNNLLNVSAAVRPHTCLNAENNRLRCASAHLLVDREQCVTFYR